MDSSLEIQVDTEVRVDSAAAPRPVLEVLRRQIRKRGWRQRSGDHGAADGLPNILETRDGRHRLPQGLLHLVTDACASKDVSYRVVDRRAVVSCPSLRCRLALNPAEQRVLRRLMLMDCGVLVAPAQAQRSVAMELLARRQQRTLVLCDLEKDAREWLERLSKAYDVSDPVVAPLVRATGECRVAVAQYHGLHRLPPALLREQFGMVVFDGVDHVEATLLLRTIRGTGARYLLGLAGKTGRQDGHQDHINLSLGGSVQRLEAPPSSPGSLGLVHRAVTTSFTFDYSGREQYQAMMASLAADAERAALVARDVRAEARGGNPCVLLSERRDHLEALRELLEPDLPCALLTSVVGPAERRREVERFEQGEQDVLLATSQIAHESLKTNRFSRLFLSFPFAHARKLGPIIGRLLQPFPGQKDALLFDYNDARIATLERSFAKRRDHFQKLRREAEENRRREAQLELPL